MGLVKKNRVLFLIVSLLFCACCADPDQRSTGVGKADLNESVSRLFHHWDDFDFDDTLRVFNPNVGEQQLVDFISLFSAVSDSTLREAVYTMLKKAEVNEKSFAYFLEKYRHYLYDPNSPMLNEGYYEHVLAYMVHAKKASETERIHAQTLLKLVRKNKPGTKAADFQYMNEKGEYRYLHAGTSNYKLLLFYDPECSHCSAIIGALASSDRANAYIDKGQLEVIAVCVLDDYKLWKDYQKAIPANWTNGWDKLGLVIGKGLYNVRAFPTLLLLNKENIVLLKDASADVILRYMQKNVSLTHKNQR